MKKRKVFWGFLVFFLFFSAQTASPQDRKNPFLVEWDDSIQKLKPGDTYELTVKFKVPQGHFIYVEKTDVVVSNSAGLTKLKKTVPKGEIKFDPFFKKDEEVYLQDFEIKQIFKVPSDLQATRLTLEGEVKYQGCSPDFCYRPMRLPLLVPLEIISKIQVPASQAVLAPPRDPKSLVPAMEAPPQGERLITLIKEGRLKEIAQFSTPFLVFLVFLAGILTDFTPCVLPIIPLTLAVIGVGRGRSVKHNFGISLSLVLGMALTYSVLGLVSAFLGLKLGFLFQSRYFIAFLVIFFVVMSLGMLDVIPFELPRSLRNLLAQVGGIGYRHAFLAGLTIGFIASPCVGPLIGPLLLYVAHGQNLFWGWLMLLTFGLGMGSLFLIGGTFYSTLGARIRGGAHTGVLKKILAFFLFLPALYYGFVLFGPSTRAVGWYGSLQEGLTAARQEGKPVLIDFFAKWCPPCLELDRKTFKESSVKEALKGFVTIKIDCTLETAPCTEAVNRFGVVGWPTILFLDRDQTLHKDLSVIGGFVGPERMRMILEEVKKRG
jgi:thioredoxin:protein disulfide reductase